MHLLIPGAGGLQHLTRALGRARALESQRRTAAAMKRGFHTHEGELALGKLLSELGG